MNDIIKYIGDSDLIWIIPLFIYLTGGIIWEHFNDVDETPLIYKILGFWGFFMVTPIALGVASLVLMVLFGMSDRMYN